MSAVTAVVQNVVIERGDDDARAAASATSSAPPYIDNGGTAVAGGTDTLDCNLATAIQNSVRNGKTVTVRTVAVSQALTTQTTAGVEVTHAGLHDARRTRSPSRRSRTATSPARRTRPSPRRSTWCALRRVRRLHRGVMDPEMDAAPDLGAPDPVAVANAAGGRDHPRRRGGLDVVNAAEITLVFAESGDVTVRAGSESRDVSAADIAARADTDEDRESVPPPRRWRADPGETHDVRPRDPCGARCDGARPSAPAPTAAPAQTAAPVAPQPPRVNPWALRPAKPAPAPATRPRSPRRSTPRPRRSP